MTPTYLLDTDTCIFLRRARPPHLVQRFAMLKSGEVAMSVITHGELHRGALRSADPAAALNVLQRIVDLAPALPMPASAAAQYGRIRVELERTGTIIGGNDLWIAAHALASGLILVTGNMREFQRVQGLKLEDWISPR